MIRPIAAIVTRNLLKLVRDKMRLFFTLFMSGMFLFIFSFVTKSMVTKLDHPLNYLLSGIIIMTVFQGAINNSMNILEDISTGFMKEILVAPITRWQIAVGHVLSSSIVSVMQGLLIIIAGFFIGLQTDFIHFVVMLVLMCLVGLTFSSLGLYLASLAKESTNFQLLISIISFPLTFLSGAYIPTMVIPKILFPVVFINPLTYTTAAFRYVSLRMENLSVKELLSNGVAFYINGFLITPAISTLFILIIGSVLFILCIKQFSKSDFSKIKVFKYAHR
jgi:ABC-2 type transport system permease protein